MPQSLSATYFAQPLRGCFNLTPLPRVARSSQPWASGRNLFEVYGKSAVAPKLRLVVILAVVQLNICISHPVQAQSNNWGSRIVSKTERPLASFINPHVSEVNVLMIDGKRFEHVRGFMPFYLPVPGTNKIIFVVDEADYSVTYHVFKMDTDEDLQIHAKSTMFGHVIGWSGQGDRDFVEKIESGRLIICTEDPNAKSTLPELSNLSRTKSVYSLDLIHKTVTGKTLYYDKSGKILLQR